jgi:ribosomal protein S11
MTRSSVAAILVVAMVVGIPRPAPVWAQDTSDFAGRWTLNRELSQFPREIGFDVDWVSAGGSGQDSTASGGRGRRGSGGGGAGALTARRESEDDAKRVQQLTAEVRNPSAHLTVVETPTAVTITDDRGQSRTFHPTGKEEVLQLDAVPVAVTAKREAGRLVVLYRVEQGRELRYTYSRVASPPQLVVDVQFIERGGGGEVRRIFEPASATETLAPAPAAPSPATTKPGAGLPAGHASDSGKAVVPASAAAQTFNQQPDAELKGLTKLGIVVEGLSPQAAACGLSQGTLETAVSKRLSDAGFRVLRNSDEDTYVYVNVITTSLSTGFCVSRYDAFLYTHTTAKLSYQETPVLVQVSLLHKGGIAGGTAAAHAEGVLRGVQEYVDQFSTRIRDANK